MYIQNLFPSETKFYRVSVLAKFKAMTQEGHIMEEEVQTLSGEQHGGLRVTNILFYHEEPTTQESRGFPFFR